MASQTHAKTKTAKWKPFLRLKYKPPIMPTPLNTSSLSPSLCCSPGNTHQRHKSAISSLLAKAFTNNSAAALCFKKMHFKSATFGGLGCASAAEASEPEILVRSSADWQGKRVRKKKQRSGRKKKQSPGNSNMVVLPDVWCAPGIGLATDATSVDCVVSRRSPIRTRTGRGRGDGERHLGERSPITRQSVNNLEHVHSLDSSPIFGRNHPASRVVPGGQCRHHRRLHRSPGGLLEIMMLQTSFFPEALDHSDQFRDMRLDIDSMSYEELLELGDKIGYVNTGLKEEEIISCLRRMKRSTFQTSPSQLPFGLEWKCSICQEEYEAGDEVGKLGCGHSYHLFCIKQWLRQKNACPVCKAAAS